MHLLALCTLERRNLLSLKSVVIDSTYYLLDYELPIARYWAVFAANGKADITLRVVMSHQADLFAITSIDADSETLLDWETMLANVATMPITKPDNADSYDSAYSALIYGWVLGGLIESVTDMSLANALRHYLTEPLGIADSCYFGVPTEKVDQVATLVKNVTTITTMVAPYNSGFEGHVTFFISDFTSEM